MDGAAGVIAVAYHRAVIPFPEVPPGQALRISATMYVTFRQCPEQARSRFQGQYPAESRPSFVGALAHRLFARHLSAGPIENLGQAVREEIGLGLNARLGAAGIHRPSQLEEAIGTVQLLYDRFRRFPGDGFEEAEVAIEAEPRPGVLLVGKVDAVFSEENGALLRDWKTGPLGDPIHQLLFYALVWALQRRELPGALEAVSVRTGERLRHLPTISDLAGVAGDLGALVTTARTEWAVGGESERRGGPWCRYCPLLEGCREGAAAVAVNQL
jgi:hypothetical protein